MQKNQSRIVSAVTVVLSILFTYGCMGGSSKCYFRSLNVSGHSPAADHAAIPPGNSVRFVAFGAGLVGGCATTASNLTHVTWSVSDTENVSISNAQDQSYGVAACLRATAGPVTVTATLPSDLNNGVTATGSSTLTCN